MFATIMDHDCEETLRERNDAWTNRECSSIKRLKRAYNIESAKLENKESAI